MRGSFRTVAAAAVGLPEEKQQNIRYYINSWEQNGFAQSLREEAAAARAGKQVAETRLRCRFFS